MVGVLAAGDLQGDRHAVGKVVDEVLHGTCYVVPVRTVGDSSTKRSSSALNTALQLILQEHGWAVSGVSRGQKLVHFRIRRQ